MPAPVFGTQVGGMFMGIWCKYFVKKSFMLVSVYPKKVSLVNWILIDPKNVTIRISFILQPKLNYSKIGYNLNRFSFALTFHRELP